MKKNLLSIVTVLLCAQINAQSCPGLGSINFQKWTSVKGSADSNLTSLSSYPNSPSSNGTLKMFEIPVNAGSNYGLRVYGYICPPVTGSYVFWFAAYDAADLWLSTSIDPTKKVKIAYNTAYTNSRQWTK